MSEGKYVPSNGGLVSGAPLIVEDLDLSGMGMYTDEQKTALGGPEDDWFLKTLLGTTMWARKSDEGVKWRTFKDTELKLHKDLIKGESNG